MRPLLAALAATFIVTPSLHAQAEELLYDPRDITEGFVLGIRGSFSAGTSATFEAPFDGVEIATTWGTGGGVLLGYGLTPTLLFYASVDQTRHDSDNARVQSDITLYHIDFGARYHFQFGDPRLVPYASLGVGGKQLYTHGFNDSTGVVRRATINARAFVVGGGFQYFFTEDFAIDGGMALSIGSFNKFDVEGSGRRNVNSDGGLTTRVMIGVNWYPES